MYVWHRFMSFTICFSIFLPCTLMSTQPCFTRLGNGGMLNRNGTARAPAGASKSTYVVRKGDTLWDIARRERTNVSKIAAWNGISRSSVLRPGQKLTLWSKRAANQPTSTPSGVEVTGETTQRVTYTVQRGDSLWAISRRYGVSIGALRRWNNLPSNTLLKPGQELRIYVDVTKQTRAASSPRELV